MSALVHKMLDWRIMRYLLASVGALIVDMGSFMAMVAAHVAPAPAAAFSYSFGIIAHWLLSSRAVFQDRVADRGRARTWQKTLFVISALVGLALTTVIVAIGTLTGLNPYVSKLLAIAASFVVTWALRSKIVFSRPAQ